MNDHDWDRRNINMRENLLQESPKTQCEKDIWNLKYILTSIGKGSRAFRLGCVSTLRRTIEMMEGVNADG